MSVIMVVTAAAQDELSRQAVAFARQLERDLQLVQIEGLYAPATWAGAIATVIAEREPAAVLAPGSDRGNELLAHVAARLDLPLAANCVSIAPGEPAEVTRVRWGGSLLEHARVHGKPLLASIAAHAVEAEPPGAEIETLTPAAPAGASAEPALSEHLPASTGGVSLTDAAVVVSGGRVAGSADGFAAIEELAGLLGGAVGCSRAVTSAGWRPHADQVGQTGTKVAPELYIACGISGATQHMAGCKGAKKLLAINTDGEASIFASADYGVIGDLHELLPAICAQIREARGA